tara:strand:- start:797 stop:1384 length:588 start_codon:yes stop_codon:yes gene_type:complete
MSGKIKLNSASGGGSFSLQAPSSSSNNRVYNLPDSAHITTLAGILEIDQWYVTINITANGDITSNLSRNTLTGSGCPLGTGMTESSGVFSFPSTGKYFVICKAAVFTDGSDNVYIGTMVTVNNGGAYTGVAYAGDGNNGSGSREGQGTTFYLLDVTDVGQVKVKFQVTSITGSSFVKGNASDLATAFTFIRMGDT